MADGEVRAQDLAQETASTLSGNEQFVMFDSTAGKRADIDDVATYVAGDKTTLKTTNKTSPVAAINENFDAIADVKEDIDEFGAFENPYIYHSSKQIVSGTDTYVMKEIQVDGIQGGEKYTCTVDSVTGATKEKPLSIYFVDSNNNVLDYSVSNSAYTNVIASGLAPANTVRITIRLYASDSGAVTATYNNIKLFKGDSAVADLNPALKAIIQPLEDKFESNLVLPKETYTVSGTGTYVFQDLFVEQVDINSLYTVFCKSITGALNSYPIQIANMNGDTVEDYIQSPKNLMQDISFSIKPNSTTSKIRIRLYASINGATTATYTDVYVLKSVDYSFMRSPVDYLKDSVIALNVPYTEAKLVPTIESVAHRGYWKFTTECLKNATIMAKKVGFDCVENDLNITSDGKYVMWHDANLANVGLPNVNINDVTLAYLKALDLGGDSFLTFEEWTYLCKKLGLKMRVDSKIEITDEVAEDIVTTVREAGMLEFAEWGSINIRNYDPHASLGFANPPTQGAIESYSYLLENGPVIFQPHITDITAENVALGHNAGFGVQCWTMEINPTYGFATHEDFVDACVNAIDCGVDGICCDNNTIYSILQEAGY